MSPVQDLVVWEMIFRKATLVDLWKHRVDAPEMQWRDLIVTCSFCDQFVDRVPRVLVREGFNFHELLRYTKHQCPHHHLALGHVLYARGRNPGGKFTPDQRKAPRVVRPHS